MMRMPTFFCCGLPPQPRACANVKNKIRITAFRTAEKKQYRKPTTLIMMCKIVCLLIKTSVSRGSYMHVFMPLRTPLVSTKSNLSSSEKLALHLVSTGPPVVHLTKFAAVLGPAAAAAHFHARDTKIYAHHRAACAATNAILTY